MVRITRLSCTDAGRLEIERHTYDWPDDELPDANPRRRRRMRRKKTSPRAEAPRAPRQSPPKST